MERSSFPDDFGSGISSGGFSILGLIFFKVVALSCDVEIPFRQWVFEILGPSFCLMFEKFVLEDAKTFSNSL